MIFDSRAHAIAAQKKYNHVALDGMAMEIELVAADAVAGGPRGAATLTSGIRCSSHPPVTASGLPPPDLGLPDCVVCTFFEMGSVFGRTIP